MTPHPGIERDSGSPFDTKNNSGRDEISDSVANQVSGMGPYQIILPRERRGLYHSLLQLELPLAPL